MVILQIIRLLLIRDESWDTFEHEIKMIGSPFHVGLQFGGAELTQRCDEALGGIEDILASAGGESSGLARARVVDDYSSRFIEFRAVGRGIRARAEQPFLFAGKENEANGTAWLESCSFYGPECVYDQGRVAAIIERTRA